MTVQAEIVRAASPSDHINFEVRTNRPENYVLLDLASGQMWHGSKNPKLIRDNEWLGYQMPPEGDKDGDNFIARGSLVLDDDVGGVLLGLIRKRLTPRDDE